MGDELKLQPTDDRPTYEPPRALRLDGTHTGTGGTTGCGAPGSGADGSCIPGVSADLCEGDGSSPVGNCVEQGSGYENRH